MKDVSLAAPAYNEADSIELIIEEWVAYLQSFPGLDSFEIIVTNDGSLDETSVILEKLAKRHKELQIVNFQENRGAAVALASAIAATTKSWVFLIDSDGQFPIENLRPMACALEQTGADVAHGVRARKENSPFTRLGSKLSGWITNRIYGSSYRDFNCANKLIRGPLARALPLEARGLNYSTDIMANLVARKVSIVEVPIAHHERRGGKSSVRAVRDATHRLIFVIYLAIRQSLIHYRILDRPRWPR